MSDTKLGERSQASKGIYLLPNLFTTGNLFAGFYAIVAAMKGHYEQAAVAIFLAMLLDTLDGRIARLTNTQSAFGAEYDSLSDIVAFGVAPALIVYSWGVSELGKLGWLSAFFYTAATAIRLARFNSKLSESSKRYFEGLPSPAGAAVLVSTIWLLEQLAFEGPLLNALLAATTVLIGLLMVSSISYYSFKELDVRVHLPYFTVVLIVLIFIMISIDPPKILFVAFAGYALSGPVSAGYRRLFARRK